MIEERRENYWLDGAGLNHNASVPLVERWRSKFNTLFVSLFIGGANLCFFYFLKNTKILPLP